MGSQNSSQKTWGYKIREFLWPLLDREPEQARQQLPEDASDLEGLVVIDEENLDQAFLLISKFADSEEERRKSIESKAILFLSSISIATTLVVASNTLLANNTEKSWSVIASVGISVILTIYTISTVWFSVRTLERGNYAVLSYNDLNEAGNATAYKKHLILTLRNITQFNSKTINRKVDNVTLAQEHYKRAIIVIGLYAMLIFLFCLFYKPRAADRQVKKTEGMSAINLVDTNISKLFLKKDKHLVDTLKTTVGEREIKMDSLNNGQQAAKFKGHDKTQKNNTERK